MNSRYLTTAMMAITLTIDIGTAMASDDHNEARRLKDAGKIFPLEQIIKKARQQHQGRIIEIELEHEKGRYIYELELLDKNGTVWEFEFDASNGELIKKEKDD